MLLEANFTHAQCRGADFAGADLTDANLAGVSMVSASLAGANLSGVTLQRADLRLTNLCGADLSQAYILQEASVAGAVYDSATRWPDGFRPEQRGARRAVRME
ncbi:MAG: pentapeptide repeat protein [Armatimonadetes bacterium]|nr:pentapeptide repeat protein [Armatimonadota bacterium]